MSELVIAAVVVFIAYTITRKRVTVLPVPRPAGLTLASSNGVMVPNTLQTALYGRGATVSGEPAPLANPQAPVGIVGGGAGDLLAGSSTIAVSYSPGTIAVPGAGSDSIRTNPVALAAAQATAALGYGAKLPAIGEQVGNSGLWSSSSMGNGQWQWNSIDGSNLSFIADVRGVRLA